MNSVVSGGCMHARSGFVSREFSRGVLPAGFALLRECLFLYAQEKAPKEAHPSSAPASPVHADAHVEAMRSGTRAALAALRHADRTGAVRRTRLAAARLRRLTMGSEYSAGLVFSLRRIKVLRGFWKWSFRLRAFGLSRPTLSQTAAPCLYWGALQSRREAQGPWMSGAPRRRGQHV